MRASTQETAPFRVEADGPVLPARGRYAAAEAYPGTQIDGRLHERMHERTSIGVVLAGRFEFRTPLGASTVAPGAMIFGHGREAFSYRYLEAQGARRAVVALSDDLLLEAAEACGSPRARFPTAALPPSRATAPLYGLVRRIARSAAPLEDDVIELVRAALTLGRSAPPTRTSARARRRVREAARRIDCAYHTDLRLAELAAMCNLSRFHFLRAFKAEVGDSPARYLIAARLRAAADRLIETREPIASIAYGVGFNDLSHFNATFRATYGASPRRWRQRVNGVVSKL
jgi:AraC family transcriptional regulator